ncbi:MAG: hypothetical protein U1E22_03665, partial [Coriobacteriia bacterium]|nr:hypothetical protein [Coriobacteriia bacterium]
MLGQAIVGISVQLPYLHASPIVLASMGLVAVLAKGVFGIFASLSQARLSTSAGQSLRDHTIHLLLQAGSNAPPPATIARIVSRIRETEDAVQRGPFAAARAIA